MFILILVGYDVLYDIAKNNIKQDEQTKNTNPEESLYEGGSSESDENENKNENDNEGRTDTEFFNFRYRLRN